MKSKKIRRQLVALLLCGMMALNVGIPASASEIEEGTTQTIVTVEETAPEAEKETIEEEPEIKE